MVKIGECLIVSVVQSFSLRRMNSDHRQVPKSAPVWPSVPLTKVPGRTANRPTRGHPPSPSR